MDLKKLPPSVLVALGLGCGPTVPDDDEAAEGSASATDSGPMTDACLIAPETVGPCLDGPISTTGFTTGPCLDGPLSTSDFTTGPCLDGVFSTTSACLDVQPTSSTTDTGTDTDTGTGTGIDTATSVCLGGIAPDAPDQRLDGQNSVRERLIEAGVLPPDVAKRLKP